MTQVVGQPILFYRNFNIISTNFGFCK